MNAQTFDELLDAAAFYQGETLKKGRLKAGLTQQQLSERIGTTKTCICRLENGKSNVKLNTRLLNIRKSRKTGVVDYPIKNPDA